MKQSVDDRAAMLGEYIVKNKATVRLAAGKFGVSKSTVHTDVVKQNGSGGSYSEENITIKRLYAKISVRLLYICVCSDVIL